MLSSFAPAGHRINTTFCFAPMDAEELLGDINFFAAGAATIFHRGFCKIDSGLFNKLLRSHVVCTKQIDSISFRFFFF